MPQPIDMQTELARMTMAERVQDAMGRASLAAQQRALLEADEDQIDAETQVHETPETEDVKVDADGRRANPFAKIRKKRKKGRAAADEASKEIYAPTDGTQVSGDLDGHELDVSV